MLLIIIYFSILLTQIFSQNVEQTNFTSNSTFNQTNILSIDHQETSLACWSDSNCSSLSLCDSGKCRCLLGFVWSKDSQKCIQKICKQNSDCWNSFTSTTTKCQSTLCQCEDSHFLDPKTQTCLPQIKILQSYIISFSIQVFVPFLILFFTILICTFCCCCRTSKRCREEKKRFKTNKVRSIGSSSRCNERFEQEPVVENHSILPPPYILSHNSPNDTAIEFPSNMYPTLPANEAFE